jgi:hypothetical protein
MLCIIVIVTPKIIPEKKQKGDGMKKNIGATDRNIRLLAGSVLTLTGLFAPLDIIWRAVFFVAAAIAVLTAFFGL